MPNTNVVFICLARSVWKAGFGDPEYASAIHLEQGHLDQVCPECRAGLAEGKGVFDIAERTQGPAFALLGGLILGPAIWYAVQRRIQKSESKARVDDSQKI